MKINMASGFFSFTEIGKHLIAGKTDGT